MTKPRQNHNLISDMSGARAALFPRLGLGLGLRPEHYADILSPSRKLSVAGPAWFEAISENYFDGGRPILKLEKVRAEKPVALHGVSLSVGSTDPLNKNYLKNLKALVDRIEPALVSDHLCWTGVGGENLHDLLPLPYTQEALKHVVRRVLKVQDLLKRRLVLENVSSYLSFEHSEMTEWEFLAEISRQADCGLLLDVNNVYVSAVNHGFDPLDFLDGLDPRRVAQIHLAGHSTRELPNGKKFLIDTHDHPVCPEVWALYGETVKRFGNVSTMVEWDAEIPSYTRLNEEIARAGAIQEQIQREVAFAENNTHQRPNSARDAAVVALAHHRP